MRQQDPLVKGRSVEVVPSWQHPEHFRITVTEAGMAATMLLTKEQWEQLKKEY